MIDWNTAWVIYAVPAAVSFLMLDSGERLDVVLAKTCFWPIFLVIALIKGLLIRIEDVFKN